MNEDQVMLWKDKIITLCVEKGPKILTAIAIIVAGTIVARFVGRIAQAWLNKRELEPPVRLLITRVVKLLIIVMFAVVALGTAGIDTAPLVAGIGVAGVGIGLAMQGVLGNLVCGLLIIFTKPFRVGEYIEIIGVHGQVHTIDLFTTILVHPDRSRIVIPNRKIVGEVLHNYGTVRQHDINLGVAYDTDLNNAMSIIRGVLERHEKVLKDPTPVVAVVGFGDSAINIAVKPWSELKHFAAVRADLYLAITDALRAAKIQMPFPQREIRVIHTNAGNNANASAANAPRSNLGLAG
jgi:small conductance mechanosensitive channel